MRKTKNGYVYKFGVDFNSVGGALTLDRCEVGTKPYEGGIHTRTHRDGWNITGEIHEDYYYWVNDFRAIHPTLGIVEGNFEDKVFATSKEAFNDFWAKHEPTAWDYGDI